MTWFRLVLQHGLLAAVIGCTIGISAAPSASQAAEVRVPFSKYVFKNEECGSSGACSLEFGQVPGGSTRRYEIVHIACTASITNTSAKIAFWTLSAVKNSIRGQIQLRPVALGSSGGNALFNANENGFVVAPGGSQLVVDVSRDGTTTGDVDHHACSIGGYDVKPE
jgi:hypothetical protein